MKNISSLSMNPPLHPSKEGNLEPALQTKLPFWEGLGVGSWLLRSSNWNGLFSLFAITLALAGCVHSLHPLYTEKDLVFVPGLIGVWGEDDSKETWAFEKGGEKEYRVSYTEAEGKTGAFQVHLLKIEGQLFLDFFPEKSGMEELKRSDFYKFHYLPVHTFARVEQIEPTLRMGFLNPEWLKELLIKDPDAIRHEKIEETFVLTASTEKLQAFVLKHVKSEKAFGDLSNLKRRPSTKKD